MGRMDWSVSVIDLSFILPILNLDHIAQLFTVLLVVIYIRGKAGLHSGSLCEENVRSSQALIPNVLYYNEHF